MGFGFILLTILVFGTLIIISSVFRDVTRKKQHYEEALIYYLEGNEDQGARAYAVLKKYGDQQHLYESQYKKNNYKLLK
ncbi:hypothetical protein [Alkalibacillus haloalkaliphilus]|uniref:hypothetical protein n=1 Tax=Alkalibacillus haloalkaliphilus TaxID=94136 RepID=UPI002935A917|nr:hypothetical protein [Alkalibacillus haloalkaliphilus]MDV2581580.1 hypothetical protein [Alkalibacillus haloalkaliphilus]